MLLYPPGLLYSFILTSTLLGQDDDVPGSDGDV